MPQIVFTAGTTFLLAATRCDNPKVAQLELDRAHQCLKALYGIGQTWPSGVQKGKILDGLIASCKSLVGKIVGNKWGETGHQSLERHSMYSDRVIGPGKEMIDDQVCNTPSMALLRNDPQVDRCSYYRLQVASQWVHMMMLAESGKGEFSSYCLHLLYNVGGELADNLSSPEAVCHHNQTACRHLGRWIRAWMSFCKTY